MKNQEILSGLKKVHQELTNYYVEHPNEVEMQEIIKSIEECIEATENSENSKAAMNFKWFCKLFVEVSTKEVIVEGIKSLF